MPAGVVFYRADCLDGVVAPESPAAHCDEGGERVVLTITDEALAVMRRVTAHSTMEPTSGLRISRRSDSAEPLHVRAVHRPRPGDTVLERDGALLYLGPDAAHRMRRP